MELVIYEDLPGRVKAFVVKNQDGSHTIIINARLNFMQQQQAYTHEMNHIDNDDFEKENINLIEYYAHRMA